jgi:microcystin-dependent protein
MSEPFLGEIRMFSFNFAPQGWAMCNGQILAINQNQALFSILGTTYGGDGVTNFQLPDLQGAVPMDAGNTFVLGQSGGEATHTLVTAEMPGHSHALNANQGGADLSSTPASTLWTSGQPAYGDTAGGPMAAGTVAQSGSGQAHNNMAPYLVINFCIALVGIFPSRN